MVFGLFLAQIWPQFRQDIFLTFSLTVQEYEPLPTVVFLAVQPYVPDISEHETLVPGFPFQTGGYRLILQPPGADNKNRVPG